MREDERPRPEGEAPATEERPEEEPTSLDDGVSPEPGEGPLDEPAGGETHRGW